MKSFLKLLWGRGWCNPENNVPYRLPQWLYGKSSLRHMMYRCNFAHHVIIGRSHCFHDCIYIIPVLLLWDLINVCRGSLTTTYVIYTYIDVGVKNLIQVWNIARHFSLPCFTCLVNSSVDRTETYVWMRPILITFVKLHCNRLGISMMLCKVNKIKSISPCVIT